VLSFQLGNGFAFLVEMVAAEAINVGSIVIATDDFTAEADQELSVSENERLKVLAINGDWCTVESVDRGVPPGLVPLSYLKFHESQGRDLTLHLLPACTLAGLHSFLSFL